MATYNGEKYLREQLDSIARQDILPLELVITDDGSTDDTLRTIEEFARVAPFPVRVFRNEIQLGYADNFLKAASLCEGVLIAFCDQDDIWMEKKLRLCSEFFTDGEVMLTAHSAWTLLASGEHGHRFPSFARTRILNPGSSDPFAFAHGFVVMIRRELLNVINPACRPVQLLGHDQWFWFLAAHVGRIATIADSLTLYRQHERNIFGARQPASTRGRATNIARNLNYDEVADVEFACFRTLLSAAEQNADQADRLTRFAKRLEFRSRLHRIRTQIYGRQSTLLHRSLAFNRVLFLGGYLPDQSKTRLGLRAAAKDMLFGVPGIYKLIAPAPNPLRRP